MTRVIPPGSTIGIVGGGQLGRMLAMAAARLGYHTHIYTPEENSPAAEVATRATVAEYTDIAAMTAFAAAVEVVTFEFENIPANVLAAMENTVAVHPSAEMLRISQNRLREKNFIRAQGIGTAPFLPVRSLAELENAVQELGCPAILKTAEMGYDGKGQVKILADTDLAVAWESLHTLEAVLEGFVDFTCEISVIVARAANGETQCFEAAENVHRHHILHTTTVPAAISAATAEAAEKIAIRLAEAVGLVGLLAVEMFVTKTGDVLVNELAPRPHNSGHWTLDAALTSQFEQQIRAICGLPLGNPARQANAVMTNIIGDEVKNWQMYLQDPRAKLHLYGKAEARPGRKMGHVTVVG